MTTLNYVPAPGLGTTPAAVDADLTDRALADTQRRADAEARSRRASWARRYAEAFVATHDRERALEIVAQSTFAEFAGTYRHSEPEMTLAFNLAITHQVVSDLCQEEEDPVALLAAVSRAVELGGHSLYDPFAPSKKPDVFLAAAKQFGYFFTPPDVAFELARGALRQGADLSKVLDPAAGAGALLGAVMIEAKSRGLEVGELEGIEIDPFAARVCQLLLSRLRFLLRLDCTISIRRTDAIERLFVESQDPQGSRYGCIVMNPPYGRVKFLRAILTNAETRLHASDEELEELDRRGKLRAKEQAQYFRQISAALGIGGGAQDFQRLFTALSLAVLASGGRLALISSDAWLGDAAATELRYKVMSERLLERLTLYPEDSGLFATVNQPTAVAVFSKEPKISFEVRLMKGRERREIDRYPVTFNEIHELDRERVRVPRVPSLLHDVYVKLAAQPRVRDLGDVKNARGELDLTLCRDLITPEKTSLRLVRGDHIDRYVLHPAGHSPKPGFVRVEDFTQRFATSPKLLDTTRYRIVGNQCAYQNKPRRLTFAIAPPGLVVSNACNYLTLGARDRSECDPTLDGLLVILNSVVAEFFFELFNSNNHVANYEIDEIPALPEGHPLWSTFGSLGAYLRNAFAAVDGLPRNGSPLEDFADALVGFAFQLTADEMSAVMVAVDPGRADRVAGMTRFLHTDGMPKGLLAGTGWFQHVPPRLSDLDRQIVEYVPQGGNWQDIPKSVPSERLAQIREMTAWRGIVRTTYYGRLRPDQPSYTIATYYNRPGNGTNIHPWENRTLTSREAARLQSFPDWYLFAGSEAAVRKQVGNAVSPLLGYAVATHFKRFIEADTWVDLFAGAGGLSLGIEEAGCTVAAAVDNNREAALTYRLNRPCEASPDAASGSTLFLESDLSERTGEREALEEIRRKLNGKPLGALVGGPPCQGFSHAGWRSPTDQRNDLATAFMRFVSELEPELVVLENVEGLLTYDKGRVVRELIATLNELGYQTASRPWFLHAETYGVPQMRRRVFLVASRGSLPTAPPPVTQGCKGRREAAGQEQMIGQLPYPVTVAEALAGLPTIAPIGHADLGKRALRPGYGAWVRGEIRTPALIDILRGRP